MEKLEKVVGLIDENKESLGDGVYMEVMNGLKDVYEHIREDRAVHDMIRKAHQPCDDHCECSDVEALREIIQEFRQVPRYLRMIFELVQDRYA